ncbi:T9SS type A sorting domain-containing protein [Flavobacterium sp. IMCC34852]|uniref:T9SS type A sorting domain-containing protein n=1 Tax=Flavobacterium rivulicola TaxID=2732161 RepID=A0A7Y3R8W4_9FLAO|nr:T9SS type A sorting domain-containing protein [Flavobacterium sp. IMCC34852]NNT71542.1 T9SS type A sorting domain-containing protein [Flavobacterium sp. IMCC34852]
MTATVNNGTAVGSDNNFIVIDANNDNEIEAAEAMAVYQLDLSNSSIVSLSGIENFMNLSWLNCNYNNLTLLPLGSLNNLNGISCMNCGLTSLQGIENLPHLQSINFSNNPITAVDLQNLPALWRIWGENTSLTTINLCGTQVRFLWIANNPFLTSLYLKNGIVSSDFARYGRQVPPPLHNFEFGNNPLLNYICYDEGEFDAVFYGINFNTTGKTLTTDCNSTCALSVPNTLSTVNFSIYPNPTNGKLNLVLSPQTIVKAGFIYDMLGQKVVTFDSVAIDVGFLSQGTYFITLETNQGMATQPFVKL